MQRDVLALGGGGVVPAQDVLQRTEQREGGGVQPAAQGREQWAVEPRRHRGEQQHGRPQAQQHPAAEQQGDHSCGERGQREQVGPPGERLGAEDAGRLEGGQPGSQQEADADADEDVGSALRQRGGLVRCAPPAGRTDRDGREGHERHEHQWAAGVEGLQTDVGVAQRRPVDDSERGEQQRRPAVGQGGGPRQRSGDGHAAGGRDAHVRRTCAGSAAASQRTRPGTAQRRPAA